MDEDFLCYSFLTMKRNSYKTPKESRSKAAAELKRLLEESSISHTQAAQMAEVSSETIRSIVNDQQRPPKPGMIYLIGRKLKWSQRRINKLLEMRREDEVNRKLTGLAEESGRPAMKIAKIMSMLTQAQLEQTANQLVKIAEGNQKKSPNSKSYD